MEDKNTVILKWNCDLCMRCGACAGACPALAIELREVIVEFNDRCTGCLRCVYVCPVGAISAGTR
ncbi:MAG: 4Fe-4S binding protein [Thermoplasmata archaeon]